MREPSALQKCWSKRVVKEHFVCIHIIHYLPQNLETLVIAADAVGVATLAAANVFAIGI